MELSSVPICPTPAAMLVAVFCIVWPFLALGMLRSRARSSAPVAAMLAGFALSTAAMWDVLELTGRGLTATPMPHAEAAGVAEALMVMGYGAFGAVLIAAFALVRRHAVVIDAVSAAIFAVTVLSVAMAILTGENLRALLTIALCRTGVVTGILAGACAVAWSVWQAMGDRPLRPVRYGVGTAVVLTVVIAAIVWQRYEHHFAIALGR